MRRRCNHIVTSLRASVEADDGMGLPTASHGIDEEAFTTVAKAEAQHRCVARGIHEAAQVQSKMRFHQDLPVGVDGAVARATPGNLQTVA